MSGRDEFRSFIQGESSKKEEMPSTKRRGGRSIGCIFLLILQIILLLVWGAFFFVVGLNVQYNQIPSQVREALIKINVEFPQSANRSLYGEPNTAITSQGVVLKVENVSQITEADLASGTLSAESKWVRVDVTIQNDSNGPIDNSIDILLHDTHNRSFQRSGYEDVDFTVVSPLYTTHERINPGFSSKRSQIYQLPQDVLQVVITLRFTSLIGDLGDGVTIEEFEFFFEL